MDAFAEQEQKAPTKRSTIESQHERLQNAITSLGDAVTKLEEGLRNVLIPSNPEDGVLARAEDDGYSTHQQTASAAANDVTYIRARIETITSRLDLA